MVLPSGELQIRNVSPEDGFKTYKCRTKHRLTGETKLSATAGRLVITGKEQLLDIPLEEEVGSRGSYQKLSGVIMSPQDHNIFKRNKTIADRLHWEKFNQKMSESQTKAGNQEKL